jgi:hypothetical protein
MTFHSEARIVGLGRIAWAGSGCTVALYLEGAVMTEASRPQQKIFGHRVEVQDEKPNYRDD